MVVLSDCGNISDASAGRDSPPTQTHQETQLAYALALQQRNGCRLGEILTGEGMVGYYDLYRAVATQSRLPFIDLIKEPPEREWLDPAQANMYLKLQMIPWKCSHNQLIMAVCDPVADIPTCFGTHPRRVITSPLDIQRTVENRFGHELEQVSRLSLWQRHPEASARITIVRHPVRPAWPLGIFFHTLSAAKRSFDARLLPYRLYRHDAV